MEIVDPVERFPTSFDRSDKRLLRQATPAILLLGDTAEPCLPRKDRSKSGVTLRKKFNVLQSPNLTRPPFERRATSQTVSALWLVARNKPRNKLRF